MPVEVVDASAVAAILFGEPEAEKVAERMEGADLVAPTLLPFEIASVCLKKIVAAPEDEDRLLRAHRLLGRMGIRFLDVEHEETVRMARSERITAYDAAYLWLARGLGVDLLTLDRDLARAARKR